MHAFIQSQTWIKRTTYEVANASHACRMLVSDSNSLLVFIQTHVRHCMRSFSTELHHAVKRFISSIGYIGLQVCQQNHANTERSGTILTKKNKNDAYDHLIPQWHTYKQLSKTLYIRLILFEWCSTVHQRSYKLFGTVRPACWGRTAILAKR